LVGCYLARELLQRGHQVVLHELAPNRNYIRRVAGDVPIVVGDVRELPALLEAMRDHQVETVVHTVGLFGHNLEDHPYTALSVNIGGTIAVAEAARLTGIKRLVFASTFGVYDWNRPPTAPVTEDFPVAGYVFYSGSKVAGERIVRAYENKYGIPVAIARFANVYGFGHYTGHTAGGAAGSGGQAIHQLVETAVSGGPVRVDPRLVSDLTEYVYAKDVARAVALAAEQRVKNQTFNVGTGVLSSYEDVARAFKTVFPKVKVEVEDVPPVRQVTHRDQPLDLTRSRKELGYHPQFDLAKGVADLAKEVTRAPAPAG
jgi:UDP-glucose 4-epimerase